MVNKNEVRNKGRVVEVGSTADNLNAAMGRRRSVELAAQSELTGLAYSAALGTVHDGDKVLDLLEKADRDHDWFLNEIARAEKRADAIEKIKGMPGFLRERDEAGAALAQAKIAQAEDEGKNEAAVESCQKAARRADAIVGQARDAERGLFSCTPERVTKAYESVSVRLRDAHARVANASNAKQVAKAEANAGHWRESVNSGKRSIESFRKRGVRQDSISFQDQVMQLGRSTDESKKADNRLKDAKGEVDKVALKAAEADREKARTDLEIVLAEAMKPSPDTARLDALTRGDS